MFSKLGEAQLQGGNQISTEPLGVLVEGVQREPAGGYLRLAGKIHQQGCFPISGWCSNDDEFPIQQVVKMRQQPAAVQDLRTEGGDDNLGTADRNFGDHGL